MHTTDHCPTPRSPRPLQRTIRCLITLLIAAGANGAALAAAATATAAPPKPVASPAAKLIATKPPVAAKPRGKVDSTRQQLKSEADGLALAITTVESISEAQLNVAMRVLTGSAECEFNERVSVTAIDGQPGHFHVGHKGLRYTMVPEETATGAVRLVDRRAGVVWLQIPVKSMLMNSRQGRRMVDACTQAEQRVAVAAAAGAAASLGIKPAAPTAADAAVAVSVSAEATVAAAPLATAPATIAPAAAPPAPVGPASTAPASASPASPAASAAS